MKKRKGLRQRKLLVSKDFKFACSGDYQVISSRKYFNHQKEKEEDKCGNINGHNKKSFEKLSKKRRCRRSMEIEMKTFGNGLKNMNPDPNELMCRGDFKKDWDGESNKRLVQTRIKEKESKLKHKDSCKMYKQQRVQKSKSKLTRNVFLRLMKFLRSSKTNENKENGLLSRLRRKKKKDPIVEKEVNRIKDQIRYLSDLLERKNMSKNIQSGKFVKFNPVDHHNDNQMESDVDKLNRVQGKRGKPLKGQVILSEDPLPLKQSVENQENEALENPKIENTLTLQANIKKKSITDLNQHFDNTPRFKMLQNALGYAKTLSPKQTKQQRFDKYLIQNQSLQDNVAPVEPPKPAQAFKEYFSSLKSSGHQSAHQINDFSPSPKQSAKNISRFFKKNKLKNPQQKNDMELQQNQEEMKTFNVRLDNASEQQPSVIYSNNKDATENEWTEGLLGINHIFKQVYQNNNLVTFNSLARKNGVHIKALNNVTEANMHFNNNIGLRSHTNTDTKDLTTNHLNNSNYCSLSHYTPNHYTTTKHENISINTAKFKSSSIFNQSNSKLDNISFKPNNGLDAKNPPVLVDFNVVSDAVNAVKLPLVKMKKENPTNVFNFKESPSVEHLFKPREIRRQSDFDTTEHTHSLRPSTTSSQKTTSSKINNIKTLENDFSLDDGFYLRSFPLLTAEDENVSEDFDCSSMCSLNKQLDNELMENAVSYKLADLDLYESPRYLALDTDEFLAEQSQQQYQQQSKKQSQQQSQQQSQEKYQQQSQQQYQQQSQQQYQQQSQQQYQQQSQQQYQQQSQQQYQQQKHEQRKLEKLKQRNKITQQQQQQRRSRLYSTGSRSRDPSCSSSRCNSLNRRNSNPIRENILDRKGSFACCNDIGKPQSAREEKTSGFGDGRNLLDKNLMVTEKLDEQGRTRSNQIFHRYDHLNIQQNNSPTKDFYQIDYGFPSGKAQSSLYGNAPISRVRNELKLAAVFPNKPVGRGRAKITSIMPKNKKSIKPGGSFLCRRNPSRIRNRIQQKTLRNIENENEVLSNLSRWRTAHVNNDEINSHLQKEQLDSIFKFKTESSLDDCYSGHNNHISQERIDPTNYEEAFKTDDSPISYKPNQEVKKSVDDVNLMFSLYLEDYKLLGKIFDGSFGKILLAKNIKSEMKCALRMVSKQQIIGKKENKMVDNLFTSSYVPGIVKNCPFFVHLYDIFQTERFFFFAMEYIDYCNLELILAFQGTFEYTQVKFYTSGMIVALEFIHGMNIIHRNIKLENVLIDSKGYPRLTDFGRCKFGKDLENALLKRKEDGLAVDLMALSDIQYVAPEVFCSPSHDRMVDYWSLGVCIQYMLTGKLMKNWQKVLGFTDQIESIYNESVISLLKTMTHTNPYSRLGMGDEGINDIMKHSFYEVIDWDKYKDKHYYVPVPDPLCLTSHTKISSLLFKHLSDNLVSEKTYNHLKSKAPKETSSPQPIIQPSQQNPSLLCKEKVSAEAKPPNLRLSPQQQERLDEEDRRQQHQLYHLQQQHQLALRTHATHSGLNPNVSRPFVLNESTLPKVTCKIPPNKKKVLRKKPGDEPFSVKTAPASPRSSRSPDLSNTTSVNPKNSYEEEFLMRLAELKYMFGSKHDFGVNLPPLSSVKRAYHVEKEPEKKSDDSKLTNYFNYYQQQILPQPKNEFPDSNLMQRELQDFDNSMKAQMQEEKKKESLLVQLSNKKVLRPILKKVEKSAKYNLSRSSSENT